MAVKKTVKKTDTKADKAVTKAASKSKDSAAKVPAAKTGKVEKAGKSAAAAKTPAKKVAAKPEASKSKAAKPDKAATKVAGKAEKSKSAPGKVLRAVTAVPKTNPVKSKGKVLKYKLDEETGRPILPKGYQPSADEEYMNPLQLEYFRQKLVARREELVEESKQTIENLKDEVRDIGDEAERASRETENALELRTRDRYRKLINKIDSVIRHVDEGDYGYCVDTGEEIGLERLEARPEAERTIDAQERWEIRRKQLGD